MILIKSNNISKSNAERSKRKVHRSVIVELTLVIERTDDEWTDIVPLLSFLTKDPDSDVFIDTVTLF